MAITFYDRQKLGVAINYRIYRDETNFCWTFSIRRLTKDHHFQIYYVY